MSELMRCWMARGVAAWVVAGVWVSPVAGQAEAPPAPAPVGDEAAVERVTLEPGSDVLLVYKGGERVEGVFLGRDSTGAMRVRVEGLTLVVPESHLVEAVPLPSIRERFAQMRGITRMDNPSTVLALAVWARDRGLLDEAIELTERTLELDRTHAEAARMLASLERRRVMEREAEEEAEERAPAAADGDGGGSAAGRAERLRRFPLISEEDANVIKVLEVDLDNAPRVVVEPDVVDDLFRLYGDHPMLPTGQARREAFRRLPDEKILEAMFRVRARELYGRVRVVGLPESLRRFRDHVNRAWVANAMATTRCHGGSNAGRLAVNGRMQNDERSVLTNLLILDRFTLDDGTPLINYAVPERSPLLHLGLPRAVSAWPHPRVEGWRPVFRNASDRAYRRTIEWIGSMRQPHPEYPVEYDPPSAAEVMAGAAGENTDRLVPPAAEAPERPADDPSSRDAP